MKPKSISLIVVLFCGLLSLTVYQNCSKVVAVDATNPAVGVASATDSQGQEVPVIVTSHGHVVDPASPEDPAAPSVDEPQQPVSQPSIPVVDEPQQPAPQPSTPVVDEPKQPAPQPPVADVNTPAVQPPEVGPSEEIVAACGVDLKTIPNAIDLAQFQGQDVNLQVVKGKTLIYSSQAGISLKSLSIETAVGRTILCGCKVDRLDLKKGRLEVLHSEIKEIGAVKGTLLKDDASILPAGY